MASFSSAEIRGWRSADGAKSFRGEFVKQSENQVTIRTDRGKELTFDMEKLHADDQKWIADQNKRPINHPSVFLGDLRFGETKAQVLARLKKNQHLILAGGGEAKSSAFGSSDPFGSVTTRKKIGSERAEVKLAWAIYQGNPAEVLHAVDIASKPFPPTSYSGKLRKSLDELVALIAGIHGEPTTKEEYPDRESIAEQKLTKTHGWKISDKLEIHAGIAGVDGEYKAVVRFIHVIPAAAAATE